MNTFESKDFLKFVIDFSKIMNNERIILSYDGIVSQDILMAFTTLTERRLSQNEANKKVKKIVYHVMVEFLQNIVKHTDSEVIEMDNDQKGQFMKSGIFIVGKKKDHYFVSSGNLILNSKIDRMIYILENLNRMDQDGLNELYKYTLKDTSISERGGAGLGLIDIARKSEAPFNYYFEKVNEEFSFFILNTDISRDK